jgi:hypothetical protein
MTSAEWADGFRRGDPETVARSIHHALQHAGRELNLQSEPDWDHLTEHVQKQLIRTGELLGEWGLFARLSEPRRDFPTEQDAQHP